jgi:predicted RNA-binding Zn-ribbon protein involved in translation (DUF1610 family)
MPSRDFDLGRRLEAVEAALGLRGRHHILACMECGGELPEIGRIGVGTPCPACGTMSLERARTDWWPPGQGPVA